MLEPVASDLFGVVSRVRVAPGLWFPLRCTIVRLASGDLVLHSPIAFTSQQREAVASLGPVRAIVAPNALHHLYVASAVSAWPQAELWVSPGLVTKRPDLRAFGVLGQGRPFFADELQPLLIDGMPRVQESVFLHGASRSLLVTDLLFNLQRYETALSRVYFGLCGVHGRLAQSPLIRFLVRDRALAGASVRRLLAHRIDRVVPCHGDVAEHGPERALARMVSWGAALTGAAA